MDWWRQRSGETQEILHAMLPTLDGWANRRCNHELLAFTNPDQNTPEAARKATLRR